MRLSVVRRNMFLPTIFITAVALPACGLTQTQDSRGRGKSSAGNEETATGFAGKIGGPSDGPGDRGPYFYCRDQYTVVYSGETTFLRFPGLVGNATLKIAAEDGTAAIHHTGGALVLRYQAPPKNPSDRTIEIKAVAEAGKIMAYYEWADSCMVQLISDRNIAIADNGKTRGIYATLFKVPARGSSGDTLFNPIPLDLNTECSDSQKAPCRVAKSFIAPGPYLPTTPSRTSFSEGIPANQNFAIKFSGLIHVPDDGEWRFKGESDGLVKVFVNHELVHASLGASHRPSNGKDAFGQPIAIPLKKGVHFLHVEYVHWSGPMHLSLYRSGPGSKAFEPIKSWHMRRNDYGPSDVLNQIELNDAGFPLSGVRNGRLYELGLPSGSGLVDGIFYAAGKPAYGEFGGIFYQEGVPLSGVAGGVGYNKGKKTGIYEMKLGHRLWGGLAGHPTYVGFHTSDITSIFDPATPSYYFTFNFDSRCPSDQACTFLIDSDGGRVSYQDVYGRAYERSKLDPMTGLTDKWFETTTLRGPNTSFGFYDKRSTIDFNLTIKTTIKATGEVTETPLLVRFYPINR